MTHIAAFDCDGTLIRGDATRRFLLLLRGPLGLALDLCRLAPQLLAWLLRRCSTAQLKEAVLNRALQAAPLRRREAALRQLPAMLVAQLRPEAVARLRWHQQHGHRCLIVSASPEPLIAPLARHLGVELIATGCSDLLQVGPGRPLRLTTHNCKGPEKLRRLEQHLGALLTEEQLEAYGDSRGDRELLQASRLPHWRSFSDTPVAYRDTGVGQWLLPAAAAALLLLAGIGLSRLDPSARGQLAAAGLRLLRWLPALYGLLALSYLGRYLRWRLLLGSCGIGGWSWPDALGWFRGFALTATPGKLGELARVQHLHGDLGYPRLPLLHAFAAERLCDIGAVLLLLAVLLPGTLPLGGAAPWIVAAALIGALALGLLWRPLAPLRQRWRQLLPQGALLRACAPALLASLAFWACEGLLLWLLVRALALVGIPATTAIAITLLSGSAGMASSMPGGLGVNEATTMLLLSQQGIPAAIALPAAVIRRLITPWSIVALAAAVAALPLPAAAQGRRDSPL
ncbi:MAG: HAD-IB family phosphatase [Cyanobacteriota bacterium]